MRRLVLAAVVAALLGLPSLAGCLSRPGSAAVDIVTDRRYTKLFVEIDYQGNNRPRDEAVELLKTRIAERCQKPGGVQVELRSFDSPRTSWTSGDLRATESELRERRASGDTSVLYILYLGGHYSPAPSQGRVLGVAYGSTSFAIFQDTIEEASRPAGVVPLPFQASDVERSVIVHEFGHIVGLVNLGTPMVRPHEDPEQRGHSNNKDSVMYWAVESEAIRRIFTGPLPTQFDENDVADLREIGGK